MCEAEAHDPVRKDNCLFLTAMTVNLVNNLRDFFLRQKAVDQIKTDFRILRQNFLDQHPARCGLDMLANLCSVFLNDRDAGLDLAVQGQDFVIDRMLGFRHIGNHHSLTWLIGDIHGQIIDAENDVLAWHDDRLATRRAQDVVR